MDNVNHPQHYTQGKVEVIDVIEDLLKDVDDSKIAYSLGQVLRYILRSPYKNNFYEDLNKAEWYLSRALDALEKEYGFELDEEEEDEGTSAAELTQTTFNNDITNVGFELEEPTEVE